MNVYEGTDNYIFVSYAHADSDRSFVEALARANILKECQKPSNSVNTQSDSESTTVYTADDI